MAVSARGSRVLIGLAILAVGVAFLLENLTDWEIPWGGWWPAILIVIGIWNLVTKPSSWIGALVLIAVGAFFLLSTQDLWDYSIGDIWRFWPVALILIGARMLFRRKKKPSQEKLGPHLDDRSSPGELDVTTIFREDKRHVTDQHFSGGRITCVFGAVKLNLVDADLAGGEATLDLALVFGGAQIRVPESWIVDVRTVNLFGGVDDDRSRPSPGDGGGRLTITGTCLFGGIELES